MPMLNSVMASCAIAVPVRAVVATSASASFFMGFSKKGYGPGQMGPVYQANISCA
jgi:hypothetical protein